MSQSFRSLPSNAWIHSFRSGSLADLAACMLAQPAVRAAAATAARRAKRVTLTVSVPSSSGQDGRRADRELGGRARGPPATTPGRPLGSGLPLLLLAVRLE